MSSAKFTVMGSPELLLLILENMDQRTLLTVAQLVCKRWHHLINRTRSIQHMLFFQPVRKRSQKGKTSGHGSEERTLNPLLAEIFAPWFAARLFRMDDGPTENLRFREKLLRQGASWRRMLVQEPPIRRLGICRTYLTRGRPVQRLKSVRYGRGLCMGALYDTTLAYGDVQCLWGEVVERLQSLDRYNPPFEPSNLERLFARSGLTVHITIQTCRWSSWNEEMYIGRYQYPITETPGSDSDAVKIEPGDNQELVQDPKNGRYHIHCVANS